MTAEDKALTALRRFRDDLPHCAAEVRIPTQGGQVFRSDPGHCSDLMAATIPI
jgi:hypothetical protein